MALESGYTSRTIIDGSDQRFYNTALANKLAFDPVKAASDLLGGSYVPPKTTSGTRSTGITFSPLSALSRLSGFTMPQPETPEPVQQGISWESILQGVGQPYRDLIGNLNTIVDQERNNINASSGALASYLSGMDPMAAYRETAPALQAPTAAASTYLGAIGADPAQVQALQNLQNQMMASQSAGQSAFGRAVDTSQANYRAAQLAEAAMNQQRAQAALGNQYGAQTTAINMARIQQENAVRQALMELQMQLIQMAAQNKGEIDLGGKRGTNQEPLTLGALLGAIGGIPRGVV